jgi:hypothetical protein
MAFQEVTMGYDGGALDRCGLLRLNFRAATAVIVSGVKINPCGLMLLKVGGCDGHYIHIAERKATLA